MQSSEAGRRLSPRGLLPGLVLPLARGVCWGGLLTQHADSVIKCTVWSGVELWSGRTWRSSQGAQA